MKWWKRLGERRRYLLSAMIFLIIMALGLMWFLEYRYFINSAFRTWSFAIGSPIPFLFNALLLFLAMMIIWAIVGKPGTAVGITWALIIVITYIHINKFYARGVPLLPEDFQLTDQTATLTKFVHFWSLAKMFIAVGIVTALTIGFNRIIAPKFGLVYKSKSKELSRKKLITQRLVIVAIAGLSLFGLTDFVRHNKGGRYEDIPFLGTHFTAWNQNKNYDDNGAILGFLYNLQKLKLETPEGYAENRIKDVKARYAAEAKKKNKTRKNPKNEDVSVVIILNESFYDPDTTFQGLKITDYYPYTGGEVLPVLHGLQKKNPSGQMYSLDYGGGTANIEFEALTGMTNYWIQAVPYTALLPKAGEVPSIANWLKQSEYQTTAIHPFTGGMYKRDIAIKHEGFDTFITSSEMDYTEHDGQSEYINDRSAYKQTLKALQEGSERQLISLTTMQNHTPYNPLNYDHTQFTIEVNDSDKDDNQRQERAEDLAIYYQSLHNSDQYLGEFIEEIDKMDKKVVVLFYGDHAAGLYSETNGSSIKNERDLSRVTPYFMHANYDAWTDDEKALPTTTPNCLVNTMLNKLNWQKSALYYLLDNVCEVEPILAETYLEESGLSGESVLEDYKLVTYDELGGRKYWSE